jgi:protein ImuB
MPLAEAVAIERHLCALETNPAQDVQALQQLATWAQRYSPLVGLEEGLRPESLLLDITGCAACFHGEDQLLRRAVQDLAGQGWITRIAIADTIGAAWGLAHYGPTPRLAPTGETEKVLRSLPVAALRLPADTLDLLAQLGLERVGQLIALPRPSLASRFGPLLLQRLDQALGRLPEPRTPHPWIPPVQAAVPFEPPTDQRQVLHHALDPLIGHIQEILWSRNWGARQIECWLHHEAAAPLRVEVNLFRPSHAFEYLRMLIQAHLERAPIAEPVCGMRLHVSKMEPLCESQAEFFEEPWSADRNEVAALIDRLGSRLGYEAVTRAVLLPDAQPEYTCRLEPLIQTTAENRTRIKGQKRTDGEPCLLLRPLRLWPTPLAIQALSIVPDGPPIQFRWDGGDYRVTRAWGPERIETGWWRCQDVQRDYYVVVTHLGNRFWLFRRREDGHWFLHGCFD